MVFNFDARLNRRETESAKWHAYDEDVIPMWVADMDFRSPDCIISALKERVEHGVFGYPIEPPEMKEVVKTWVKDRYGWSIDLESICFLPGVVTGFNLACHTLAGPGKSVVYHTPAYPPFSHVAENTDSIQHEVELVRGADGSYHIDFDVFEAVISQKTGMYLLCNPQNPTGRVFRRDELEKIAEICLRHGVMVCSDEIHADFVYSGHQHIPFASLSSQVAQITITLLAPSKTFNIAGLDSSVAIITNPELRKKFLSSKKGLMGSTNLLGRVATIAAYGQGAPWLDALLKYLESNRDFLFDFVKSELPGIAMGKPEGTYLAWLDCRNLKLNESPCQYFIEKARVAMNDGERFGECGKNFIRINFGCPRAQLVESLGRIKKSLG